MWARPHCGLGQHAAPGLEHRQVGGQAAAKPARMVSWEHERHATNASRRYQKAVTEGFLVSERLPGSPDGMPDGRADVRGPVRVHRKAAKTPVREAVRGPA